MIEEKKIKILSFLRIFRICEKGFIYPRGHGPEAQLQEGSDSVWKPGIADERKWRKEPVSKFNHLFFGQLIEYLGVNCFVTFQRFSNPMSILTVMYIRRRKSSLTQPHKKPLVSTSYME